MRSVARSVALLGVALSCLVTVVPGSSADAAAVPVAPSRALDTRSGIGGVTGPVAPGQVVRFSVPGAAAAGATAVALNVTATDASGDGYVTAWSCDQSKPATSNLNFVPGRSVPNMVVVQVSQAAASRGTVCLDASAGVQLIADVMGLFTGTGDLTPTQPNRILDTRLSKDPLQPAVVRHIRVAGTAGVSANASAVALNVTVTSPRKGGFVSMFPCSSPNASGGMPTSSSVNFQAGDTVAAFTMTAIAGGEVCAYSDAATDFIVDTFGWMPAAGGLRVKDPERVLDTRNGIWSTGAARSGETVRVRVAGRGGVPNEAAAAMFTLTVADTSGSGYVTAWSCDDPQPNASVLNFWPGAVRANSALLPLSASGEICLSSVSYNGSPVSLIADAVGFVPGSVSRPPVPAPPTPPAPPAPSSGRFATLPPGAALPSGAQCAALVRPAVEIRPENNGANHVRGSRANANTRTDWSGFNRVDGDFVGTTDEIIQWAACKWGIDEDIVRAQVVKESYWYQSANGDNGESWGLGQVRDTAHQSAFQYSVNARSSSAYNLDYTYASWRACYEGVYTWLNTVEHNGTYSAGDVWGCVGVWFSGRWYVNNDAYLNQTGDSVHWHYNNKTWLTSAFVNG